MIQSLPRHDFGQCKKAYGFIPEKVDKLVKKGRQRYILEVDVKYPEKLHEGHNELSFLAEKMKTGKVKKSLLNIKDKKRYVVHIKKLNQSLKKGLELEKVH